MAHYADHHVLLRVFVVSAAKVALHHVLVESSSGYHREDSGYELLEEITLVVDVIEEEDLAHAAVGY